MYVVFSYFSDEGEICLAYREGGIGSAIGQAIAWARLTGSTLLQVRCLGQRLSMEQAQAVFNTFNVCPTLMDGRAIWANGEVLDRRSDRR